MTQLQVQYTDHMGNDDSVVNAARVSFAKEGTTWLKEGVIHGRSATVTNR